MAHVELVMSEGLGGPGDDRAQRRRGRRDLRPRRAAPLVRCAVMLTIAAAFATLPMAGTRAVATSAPTVPDATEPSSVDLAAPGPHPVGVTTLTGADGLIVEVWYPAVGGTVGTVTYDVRDLIPPAVSDLLTTDLPATFSIVGRRDAAPADGRHPIVLFSHGFSGFRQQSSFLTSHLASHGMVVVAPDHPGRDLFHVLSGSVDPDRSADVADLTGALSLVLDGGGPLTEHVNADRVGALGHSAGGGTVLAAAASEPRIDGVVSMAAGGPDDAADYPAAPIFFLAGSIDAVVPAASATALAFERAPGAAWYWLLDGVGHNGFSDLCTFGGGTGIIGLADASGLGPVLDAMPELRTLGEDGCIPPAVPVADSFPVIRIGVTAWLQWLFGDDPQPIDLDPLAATTTLDVTSASHPATG